MIIAKVQEEIAGLLDTIEGLRAYPWARNTVTPPAALVMLPESITYDATYARGADQLTLDVLVLVGKASDRASHLAISGYAAGSGPASVKTALERPPAYASCDSVHVHGADFDVVRVSSVDYLAAVFHLDIIGQGEA